MVEVRVIHDEFERLKPQRSLSDALVSVHPASKSFFRIVQVHCFQVADTHEIVKLLEGVFKRFGFFAMNGSLLG